MCVRVRTCAPEILSLGENFKKRYPHLLYTWFFTSFHPLEAVKCQLCSSRNIINSGVCVCVFVCSMGWWRCTIRPKEKIGSKRVAAMEDDAEKPKHRKVKKKRLDKTDFATRSLCSCIRLGVSACRGKKLTRAYPLPLPHYLPPSTFVAFTTTVATATVAAPERVMIVSFFLDDKVVKVIVRKL